jgi:hypothetical protein
VRGLERRQDALGGRQRARRGDGLGVAGRDVLGRAGDACITGAYARTGGKGGDVYFRAITIPEGLTARETVELLAKNRQVVPLLSLESNT